MGQDERLGLAPDADPRRPRDFLSGGGELGARIRVFDWAKTSLGRPERWPRSLKTAVRIMLTSRQPFWIGWGKELTYSTTIPMSGMASGHAAAVPSVRLGHPSVWCCANARGGFSNSPSRAIEVAVGMAAGGGAKKIWAALDAGS